MPVIMSKQQTSLLPHAVALNLWVGCTDSGQN
jgi:hypothetical protein